MKLSLPPALSGQLAELSAKLSLDALNERERRMVLIGAVAVVLILIFGLIVPLDRSVASAQQRIGKKQADLLRMRQIAPELIGAALPPAATQESLLVIVDRSARESGLSSALKGTEPNGPGALSVRLERASFDMLVAWLARLSQQNGIRVDNASIDSTSAPGIVNAALVLRTG
jgi:general secretion pathway protein M